MPPRMRKTEMEAAYRRIKEVIKTDPDITDKQLQERFGIGYRKVAELRAETEKANVRAKGLETREG